MKPTPPFAFPIRVYWEDTDAGGIVFYANYLKFFERARTEWLRTLGLEQRALRESTGGMFVVGQSTLRYLRPARLDDELLVTAVLAQSGRASLTIAQQAYLQVPPAGAVSHATADTTHAEPTSEPPRRQLQRLPEQGALLCEGTIRIGWVEASTLRPARLPSQLLEALEK